MKSLHWYVKKPVEIIYPFFGRSNGIAMRLGGPPHGKMFTKIC